MERTRFERKIVRRLYRENPAVLWIIDNGLGESSDEASPLPYATGSGTQWGGILSQAKSLQAKRTAIALIPKPKSPGM